MNRLDYINSNPCFNIHNGICYIELFKLVKNMQNSLNNPLYIVELGTRKWGEKSTHHKNDFYVNGIDVSNYILTDYLSGEDVDKIADIHKFTDIFMPNSIDIIYSGATFEHLKYPWIAAHELMKSLKIGGYIYICTNQSFPLHGYPNDFYRFSRTALESLFSKEMGMEIINTWYDFLADVVPNEEYEGRNKLAESYLNVNLIAKKNKETPITWIYDLEKQ